LNNTTREQRKERPAGRIWQHQSFCIFLPYPQVFFSLEEKEARGKGKGERRQEGRGPENQIPEWLGCGEERSNNKKSCEKKAGVIGWAQKVKDVQREGFMGFLGSAERKKIEKKEKWTLFYPSNRNRAPE
jgi:hypothetical protein